MKIESGIVNPFEDESSTSNERLIAEIDIELHSLEHRKQYLEELKAEIERRRYEPLGDIFTNL